MRRASCGAAPCRRCRARESASRSATATAASTRRSRRIINEQVRPQLGRDWGEPDAPLCGGLRVTELARVDWSRVEPGRVAGDPLRDRALPDTSPPSPSRTSRVPAASSPSRRRGGRMRPPAPPGAPRASTASRCGWTPRASCGAALCRRCRARDVRGVRPGARVAEREEPRCTGRAATSAYLRRPDRTSPLVSHPPGNWSLVPGWVAAPRRMRENCVTVIRPKIPGLERTTDTCLSASTHGARAQSCASQLVPKRRRQRIRYSCCSSALPSLR